MIKKLISFLSILVCLNILIFSNNYQCKAAETSNMINSNSNNVRLQDDFYKAVNKEWIENSKLQNGEDEKSNFTEVKNKVDNEINTIFDELLNNANKYKDDSEEKKIVNLYNNVIDMKSRNQQGMEPLKEYINKVENVENLEQLTNLFCDPKINILNNLIQFGVDPDNETGKKYLLYIKSTPLLLGDSTQYVNQSNTSNNKIIMKDYLSKILKLSGYKENVIEEKINNLFKFEESLAPSILGIYDFFKYSTNNKDVYKSYSLEELDKLAPNLNIAKIMNGLGYDKAEKIILFEPKWLEKLNELYTEENLEIIKDYTEICMISSMARYLSEDFKTAYSEFQKGVYYLNPEKSLEDESIELVNKNFKKIFYKLYVKRNFNEEIRKDIANITEEIINTYKQRINSLDWMSNSTKENAIKKLNNLKVNIGYSEQLEDYSQLDIKSYEQGGSLFNNIINIELFSYKENIKKINGAVKRTKLPFGRGTAIDVNAYYDVKNNEIIIPAAILQPPFYDINAKKEKNLGAIGAIIAHEISHAFDNTGAHFDENGESKDWWSEDDYKKYNDKIKRIIDFYGNIKSSVGENIDGKITLSENIADIGSMTCVLDVLNSMPNADYDSFFKSFATIWRGISTKENEKLLLKTDGHAPSNVRVNTVVQQFKEFYNTYNITENDGMYVKLEDRLSIW